MFFKNFTDTFFFCTALTIGVMVFIDFLLGEKKRGKLREVCGDFWLFLSEKNLSDLAIFALSNIQICLSNIFSSHFISQKRFFVTSAFVVFFYIILALYYLMVFPREYSNTHDILFRETQEHLVQLTFSDVFSSALVFLPVAYALVFLSIAVTQFFIQRSVKSQRRLHQVIFLLLDLSSVSLLFFLIFATLVMAFIPYMFAGPDVLARIEYASWPAVILSSLPTLSYAAAILLFWGSKIFKFALQPLTMTLLIRLHESPKGVLTNVSVFIGVIAKLLQQAVKIWG